MAKFFVALSALVLIAGCSCNKDAADTTTTDAPATGDAAAAPMDAAAQTPTEGNAETMGAATPVDAMATPAR